MGDRIIHDKRETERVVHRDRVVYRDKYLLAPSKPSSPPPAKGGGSGEMSEAAGCFIFVLIGFVILVIASNM